MKVFTAIENRAWIASITDNRSNAGSIVVTLNEGYFFNNDREANAASFNSVRDTAHGTSRNSVFNPEEDAKKEAKVKVPRTKRVVTDVAPVTAVVPTVETAAEVTKPTKALSMSKDAVRKREKRLAAKAVTAV